MSPDHKAYHERSMTRGGVHARMRSLLQSMGMDDGESMHSFRRGMAMQQRQQGASLGAIATRMLIQTEKIVHSTYLPAGRHDSGITRIRQHGHPLRPDPVSPEAAPGGV